MNNNATAITTAEKNVTAYFLMLDPLQAKAVLSAMTLLPRLDDSRIPEVCTIVKMYGGDLQGKAVKELTGKLAKAYAEKHPGALLTKKSISQYTDVCYRKLYEAVGNFGFDYVLSALRHGKAFVNEPANGIDEKQMLRAMRWEERREEQDVEKSNMFHRKKGLQLAGLGDMAEVLVEHSFIIANVYELVQPDSNVSFAAMTPVEHPDDEAEEQNGEQAPMTVREMKIHFIEKWAMLQDFYGTKRPACPDGYSEEELTPDSVIVGLAHKGLLTNSKEVLDYVERQSRYVAMLGRMSDEFNQEELNVIMGQAEKIKMLIDKAW